MLALGWIVLGPKAEEVPYAQSAPVAFNFRYAATMGRAGPGPGELVRVERRREDGLFLDSFAVSAVTFPPYRGEASGMLPAVASAEVDALRRRFPGAELVQEGKVRVNEVPGYALQFRARQGTRRLFGRLVLLLEPLPGARRGVRLLLLGTPAAGVVTPEGAGSEGATKLPYRTFRFGTEAP